MRDRWEKDVTWLLAVILTISVVLVMGIAINPPQTGNSYTEFYILGQDETASYPSELTIGESANLILGISNHERERSVYTVIITWNRSEDLSRTVEVSTGETREMNITLTAPQESGLYQVHFRLYRGGVKGEPYRLLRLQIRVTE